MKLPSLRRQLLIAAAAIAVLAVMTVFVRLREKPEALPQRTAGVPSAPVTQEPPVLFLLGVHEGQVAVFPPKGGPPLYVTETRAASLPAPDQQALDLGIPVASREELTQLLEDYGS